MGNLLSTRMPRSYFPAGQALTVLVQGTIPPQVQDSIPVLVELNNINAFIAVFAVSSGEKNRLALDLAA